MAWNEECQVAKSRVKTIVIFFFRCCRNYPARVCSLKDHSEQSLLFGSDGTSLRTHAPCQKRAVPKSQLLLLHETCPSLRVRCEGISSFQIVLCDQEPPYPPYLAPAEFSLINEFKNETQIFGKTKEVQLFRIEFQDTDA